MLIWMVGPTRSWGQRSGSRLLNFWYSCIFFLKSFDLISLHLLVQLSFKMNLNMLYWNVRVAVNRRITVLWSSIGALFWCNLKKTKLTDIGFWNLTNSLTLLRSGEERISWYSTLVTGGLITENSRRKFSFLPHYFPLFAKQNCTFLNVRLSYCSN